MPKDADVVSLEPIEAAWGNQTVRDKLVQRADDAADLASGWPAPQNGEVVWQIAEEELRIWDGEVWRQVVLGPHLFLLLAGGTMTGTLEADAAGNAWTALDPAILTSDYITDPPSEFGYWKTPGGAVHLTGRIANVDPGTIGGLDLLTLPEGLRPNTSTSFPVFNQMSVEAIRLAVNVTGAVTFPAGGPGNWFELSGISFWAGW